MIVDFSCFPAPNVHSLTQNGNMLPVVKVLQPCRTIYCRGKEGNWHVLMEQAPIPGAQSCIPSLYMSLTNTPYLPVLHSVQQGEMSICRIHKDFSKDILTQQKRMHVYAIWVDWDNPTKDQPLGEDCDNKSPTFLHYLSQVCQAGHTIDRRIKPSMLSYKSCWEGSAVRVNWKKVLQHAGP